jgi:hypothetical protein
VILNGGFALLRASWADYAVAEPGKAYTLAMRCVRLLIFSSMIVASSGVATLIAADERAAWVAGGLILALSIQAPIGVRGGESHLRDPLQPRGFPGPGRIASRPLYLRVFDRSGVHEIHQTSDAIRWNASELERYTLRIPARALRTPGNS